MYFIYIIYMFSIYTALNILYICYIHFTYTRLYVYIYCIYFAYHIYNIRILKYLSLYSINILYIYNIKCFRTIVFIFIVISTTFRSICPPAFFRCLSNSGTFTELRTTSFIKSTVVACFDSVSHNRV